MALDALAHVASHGRRRSSELVHAVLDEPARATSDLLAGSTRPAALALALAWAGWAPDHEHQRAAAEVFAVAVATTPQGLSARLQLAAAQTLLLVGRHADLEPAMPYLTKIDERFVHHIRTDLAHPGSASAGPSAGLGAWPSLLAEPFVAAGLEPIGLAPDPRTDWFDRLRCIADRVASDALVTVVVPVLDPDDRLVTSVTSLLAQTWHDLEIVVVDDGSGPTADDVYDRVVALDGRIRVVRMPSNAGRYTAVNEGIRQARGSYVLFQDADDWSHPRRIEQQITALRTAGAPASQSLAVRARPDLTHQWFGYPPIRPNASSLVLTTDLVERVGPFLEVRKGADSEYIERVRTFAGELAMVEHPLAVVRLGGGSLSRSDFGYYWHSPERIDFRESYRAWHRRLADLGTPPPLPATPGFDVPSSYRSDTGAPAPAPLPHAWIDDLSSDPTGPEATTSSRHLWSALDTGSRVGLWHLQSPTPPVLRRLLMHPSWYDRVVRTDLLSSLQRLESQHVEDLVVNDPRLLLVQGDQPCLVSVDRVSILVDAESLLLDDPDGLYLDVLGIADVCARWWGKRPTWRLAPWCSADDADRVRTALPGLVRDAPS